MSLSSTTLAPIVLFVYNRPWHTKQTLEALAGNDLAELSHLYIYSDGARENANNDELSIILDVRKYIKTQQWCSAVTIIERPRNFGLADNLLGGVSEVLDKHEKVIVLEDDIVTSKQFLTYMNASLEMYCEQEEVACVSGYIYPIKNDQYAHNL